MLEGLVEFVMRELLNLLREGGRTALSTALENLFSIALPPLTADFFQGIYARMWGLAIFIAIVAGLIGAVRASINPNLDLSAVASLTYFVRIYGLGLVLPAAVGLGLLLGDLVIDSVVLLSPDGSSPEQLESLSGAFAFADTFLALILAATNWLLGWLLAGLVLFLTWGVLPLLVLAIAMSGLGPIGRGDNALARWSYVWLLVAIVAKPVIALVLVIGHYFVGVFRTEIDIQFLPELTSLAILALSIYLPWRIKRSFETAQLPGRLASMTHMNVLASSVGAANSNVRVNLTAMKQGVQTARQKSQSSGAAPTPGQGRRVIATGMQVAASKLPNKGVKLAGTAGARLLSRSADKAATKHQSKENQND